MSTTEVMRITKNCKACGQPMHLWQDSSGSGWMHDKAADELACWQQHRGEYEAGRL